MIGRGGFGRQFFREGGVGVMGFLGSGALNCFCNGTRQSCRCRGFAGVTDAGKGAVNAAGRKLFPPAAKDEAYAEIQVII